MAHDDSISNLVPAVPLKLAGRCEDKHHEHGHGYMPMPPEQGKRYWRSLEEVAGTAEFEAMLHREFPVAASEWRDEVSRREFVTLMGASLALAGLAGCSNPTGEKIVPYVVPPEQQVPGTAVMYASAVPFMGQGLGVLVETHEGRPTKIEGNPQHPASRGATDVFAQASILALYDPDRAQTVRHTGEISSWSAFTASLQQRMAALKQNQGAGLRVLTDAISSPTLAWQLENLKRQYPQAKIHSFEPCGNDNARAGARLAFGEEVNVVYHLDRAERVLAIDADFLCHGATGVRQARDFSQRRKVRVEGAGHGTEGHAPSAGHAVSMSRLYAVETMPTSTGIAADHRLALKPSQLEPFVRALLGEIGRAGSGGTAQNAEFAGFVSAIVKDFTEAEFRGKAVVVIGDALPPAVHAMGHAINEALGALGTTVTFTDPISAVQESGADSLASLASDMEGGVFDTLIILRGNPAFTAPSDLNFGPRLRAFSLAKGENKQPKNFTAQFSLYYEETSYETQWHVPEAHFLEAWSDVRTFDGTATIIQPMIEPLYQGKSVHEFMAGLLGQPDATGREIVRAYWMKQRSESGQNSGDFEGFWQQSLQTGIVEGTQLGAKQVTLNRQFESSPATQSAAAAQAGEVELVLRPDPMLWDGRFANNAWLQELPRPLTKLTWDNAAIMSPKTAVALNLAPADETHLANEKLVRVVVNQQSIELPVWVQPGHADGCVTIHLGYGRERIGRVGVGVGKNAYKIRTSQNPWYAGGARIENTGNKYPLACTQPHQMIEGRPIIRALTVKDFAEGKAATKHPVHLSLYPEYDYDHQRKWGMSIDMTACMGCNACVIACQAENNIPVVGKTEVIRGREMHWLRIDHYYQGSFTDPIGPYLQPMLCQHCEKAPCEYPCPVEATSHSAEGINEMTYNRCIGTRYCANNCPYKVRRFNFYQYSDSTTPVKKLMYNPNVTVRRQGVMEKCSFCVQRVNETRIEIKKSEVEAQVAQTPQSKQAAQGRIHDLMHHLQSACQQVCPTQAIVFGDLNYKDAQGHASEVKQLHDQPHAFKVLSELNTEPRVSYLASVKNPNPAWPAKA